MKTIVRLTDHADFIFQEALKHNDIKYIPEADLRISLNYWINCDLSYNQKTGKTYASKMIISTYVYKNDIPKYDSEKDCAFWELTKFIRAYTKTIKA